MKKIPRLFQNIPLTLGSTVLLSQASSHYLLNVLRMRPFGRLNVFNGDGYEYESLLLSEHKGIVSIEIQKQCLRQVESSLHIHLGQALSKSDHMDFTIQKSVELGVREITPLLSQHSEKYTNTLQKKLVHWERIMISAVEQCGRVYIPILHPPILFVDWLKKRTFETAFILDPAADKSFLEHTIHSPTLTAIGPEGGFSKEEIAIANQQGFSSVHLGSRILRTETASIVTLTALQLLKGDMGKQP